MQAREAEVDAQLRAMEEEARRAAAAAAVAPAAPARAPLAPAPPAHDDVDMGAHAEADEFEDAENLPNINKMTMAQVHREGALGLARLQLAHGYSCMHSSRGSCEGLAPHAHAGWVRKHV